MCDPHRIRKLALERKARDPNDRGCVVYSIGSNGDFNFELGIQVREVLELVVIVILILFEYGECLIHEFNIRK